MKHIQNVLLVALALVAAVSMPLWAQSPEQSMETQSYVIDSDEVITVQGAVSESPKGTCQNAARRRTLSSRGGRIVATAQRYLGTPYRWAGTTPSGFDCSGFVMTVFGMNGVSIRRMADEQYYGGNRIARKDLCVGDLVFFSTYGPGVTHVGIYVGEDKFIHSSSRRGVTFSSLDDAYYKARFIGGCRY
ncbi:MAG: C40 family peptidase [Candidatus Eremiobacteraeota bacterium]|nr:C40 family peptidase [Candidatus Eremiobacteraeota bacterium]